jgi:adenylate cyclase
VPKASLAAKVRYPIGVKLVVIISIISLVSLGAITALSTFLMTNDVRLTAEDHNYEVNRMAASRTEESLSELRVNADLILSVLEETGGDTAAKAAEWFFGGHRDIAAVTVRESAEPDPGILLVNERFFLENGIDPALASSSVADNAFAAAAAGEVLLCNASPALGAPLTALVYPRQDGTAAAVLFSTDVLADVYGSGANSSYLINGDADVLIHPDTDLVLAGANVRNDPFVTSIREDSRASLQNLYTGSGGVRYFGAFTKLSFGGAAVITNVEYSHVFEGVSATTRRNIYLTVAVLFISGILIWLFSKTISLPMKGLTIASERIENGDFEIELESKTHDEIGVLTDSFTRMSKALGIFGRFTNREIARRAMRGEIKPGGQSRHGTIFFSDIRGFTEKSENFTREFGDAASDKIVYWLNEYFTRMVDCVEKTNGVVDKFIGDAVMAHWGTAYTSGSPEKDAYNCVKAALGMRAALVNMNKSRTSGDPGNPPIRIGCGINSGIVTAGQIGSEQRMEYTVIGDPVNLASRTEALNKPFGTDILITENTWLLIGRYLITEEMPPVKVKGKEKPIRMFAVINLARNNGSGPQTSPRTGPQTGPRTLAELRTLLGIPAPDLSKIDTGEEEKKYKIGTEG